MDLASKIIKNMFIIILVLIGVIIVNNLVWIWYINQYDYQTEYVDQEATNNEYSTITQTGVAR